MGLEVAAVSRRQDQGRPVLPGHQPRPRCDAWLGLQLGDEERRRHRGLETLGRSGTDPSDLGQGHLRGRGGALDLQAVALPVVGPHQHRGVEGADRTDHRRRLLRQPDRRHQGGAEGLTARDPEAGKPYRFSRELPPGALSVAMNVPSLLTLALVLAYPIYYAAYLSFHK